MTASLASPLNAQHHREIGTGLQVGTELHCGPSRRWTIVAPRGRLFAIAHPDRRSRPADISRDHCRGGLPGALSPPTKKCPAKRASKPCLSTNLTPYQLRSAVRFLPVSASSSESRVALPAQMLPVPVWAAAAMMGAVVVSVAASFSPAAALAATVAIAAVVAVAVRPALLPPILVVSIFAELVRVEGATISRVLAPIALFVVLVQLIRGKASIRPATPLFWAAAYGLWALASGLWTTSTAGTVFQLSSLLIAVVYMLAFASLIESRRDLERVVWVDLDCVARIRRAVLPTHFGGSRARTGSGRGRASTGSAWRRERLRSH